MKIPGNPDRWSMLGLDDPKPDASLPKDGQTADLLAFALVLPGAEDPVEGIIDGVRVELAAMAEGAPSRANADALMLLGRRLDVAMLLLRRSDERAPMPPEYDPDAVTQTAGPAEPPEEEDEP
jgi:hypothetical protein